MYARKKRISGRNYIYIVEAVREGKKVRQKIVAYLGPVGLGEKAAKQRLRKLRKKERIPKTEKIVVPKKLLIKKKIRKLKPKLALDHTFPSPIKEEVRDILKMLENHKLSFLVGGMNALNAYFGIKRVSRDLDLFVTTNATIGRIRYVLREEGIKTSRKRTAKFLPIFSKYPGRDESIIDIQTKESFGTELTKESIERAIPLKYMDLDTEGMSVEEIILLKASRFSEEDRSDIEAVKSETEKRNLKLDWDYIEDRAQDMKYSAEFKELKAIFGKT